MGFDGSSITGFNAIEESDMIAMPDPTTFAMLPWRPEDEGGGVARMFADVLTPEREPYEGDPRHVLRRAEERMQAMGFDHFYVGPELEYFLFRDNQQHRGARRGRLLRPHDARRRLGRAARDRAGAREARHRRRVLPPRGRARRQHEIDMRYADALKMADDCMTYRITVKEYAMKYGWHATFMPKPLFGENGSGMHTHQSLFKDGRNAFYDADDQYFLSDVGKAFIAGQLRHAREICSIFAQWVNSYKRLVPGYEAPVYVAWSRRNRSALVRVPLYHPGKEQATRMELRCPDPACNPYLTFAVLLQAGPRGDREGLRAARADGEEPLPPVAGRPEAARHRAAARDARARRSRSPRSPSSCCARSASTSSTATSRSSARSGRTTASRSRPGSSSATCRSSETRRRWAARAGRAGAPTVGRPCSEPGARRISARRAPRPPPRGCRPPAARGRPPRAGTAAGPPRRARRRSPRRARPPHATGAGAG